MHKLMEYICDELEEIERKVGKGENLSANELQYADMLMHLKKNILKVDDMSGEDEFSYAYMHEGKMMPNSYAPKRDYMGRYSRRRMYSRDGDVKMKLADIMEDIPNENIRMEIKHLIDRM